MSHPKRLGWTNGAKQGAAADSGFKARLRVDLVDRLCHELRDRRRREELAELVAIAAGVDRLELLLWRRVGGGIEHAFDPRDLGGHDLEPDGDAFVGCGLRSGALIHPASPPRLGLGPRPAADPAPTSCVTGVSGRAHWVPGGAGGREPGQESWTSDGDFWVFTRYLEIGEVNPTPEVQE